MVLAFEFDFGVFWDYLFDDQVINGVWVTLQIAVLAQLIGIILGVIFALMRTARNPIFGIIGGAYVWFFRGTPALLQLLILYFGLPQFVDNQDFTRELTAFRAAVIAFGINEGAYMTEIMRAGILSVEHGQMDAAKSVGMTQLKAMRHIILPQALRVVVPPTGNEFIALLKNSSVAFTIGLVELLGAANLIYSVNFKYMELLMVAGVWYLAIVTDFSILQAELERYLARGERERPQTIFSRVLGAMGTQSFR
jgi:polar amino acid transport system permease protein